MTRRLFNVFLCILFFFVSLGFCLGFNAEPKLKLGIGILFLLLWMSNMIGYAEGRADERLNNEKGTQGESQPESSPGNPVEGEDFCCAGSCPCKE
jgi:TM2 domain-containing membrane protein YozV